MVGLVVVVVVVVMVVEVSCKIILIENNIARNNVCSYHLKKDRHKLTSNKVSHANRETMISQLWTY